MANNSALWGYGKTAPNSLPRPDQPRKRNRSDPYSADGMASEFGRLNIGQGSDNSTARTLSGNSERGGGRQPRIRSHGPPSTVLFDCPAEKAIEYGPIWFRMPEIPDFLACSRCYEDHIRQTPHARVWTGFKPAEGVFLLCSFWKPRMADILWPQAGRTGDLSSVREYMEKRLHITNCYGIGGAAITENVKWYAPRDQDPAGLVSCEACYEDYVVGTAFESMLTPSPLMQRTGESWSCDICIPHVKRAIAQYAAANDWPCFAASAARRIQLPPCEGKVMDADSQKWYQARQKIKDMVICEACHLDRIALTSFDPEFEITGTEAGQQNICDMASMSMMIAFDTALEAKDYKIYWNAATTIMTNPPCSAEGPRDLWYTLRGGCENFDLCAGCFAGIMVPNNAGAYFERTTRDPQELAICDFNLSGAPRAMDFLSKFAKAVDLEDFSIFSNYVRKFANLPTCPRMDAQSNAVWYGFPDLAICPDCYESVVVSSKPALQLPIQGVQDPRPTTCSLYSPRMRQKWAEACASSDIETLVAFSRHRLHVYSQTVPAILSIKELKEARLRQATIEAVSSSTYQGLEQLEVLRSMDNSLGNVYGQVSYGNSTLGWHPTLYGVNAERLTQSFRAGLLDPNSLDELRTMSELEAQWLAVE